MNTHHRIKQKMPAAGNRHFLSYRKLRNYSPAVLHNRAYKKALIGGSMVQACLLFYFSLYNTVSGSFFKLYQYT